MNHQELRSLYDQPLFTLIDQAREVHRAHWPDRSVQLCTLLSIKTGLCPEDCGYCSQSVHNASDLRSEPLMQVDQVLKAAERARANGSTRFCMGAGWREPKDGPEFDAVLDMVRGVRAMGMEACVTLGMLTQEQSDRLRDAGLTSYNHNVDTSPEHYGEVIKSRTFQDRIDTLQRVAESGVQICSGGILGLGETIDDRLKMLEALAGLNSEPTSIPINKLVPIGGTPMAEGVDAVSSFELVRMIAVTRIAFPRARVRLSAGRESLNDEAQALCFLAGANSIFYGDQLLTTGNPESERDLALLETLGLVPEQVEVPSVEA